MRNVLVIEIIFTVIGTVVSQKDLHLVDGRHVVVQLFEWKWRDIAQECEDFLAPRGYGGVQISPPNEHVMVKTDTLNRPWWERYHPVSYQLVTRSGNEEDLADMISRCNKVGVRIYADAVLNHMSGWSGTGTGGSNFDVQAKNYPSVPYDASHFHQTCDVTDYNDAENVRDCQLDGRPDLDQSQLYVRQKIVEYLNKLVSLGVAGFRIDSAKYMYPEDLKAIYDSIDNLNTDHGFEENSRPFILQDVDEIGYEAISKLEYVDIGTVSDPRHSIEIGNLFFRNNGLDMYDIITWGAPFGCIENATNAVHSVDDPKYQRNTSGSVATYQNKTEYIMATALMIGHPYVVNPRFMSSYEFTDNDQGPPSTEDGEILSPEFDNEEQCTNGWVCEHRWNAIANLVEFRNTTYGNGYGMPLIDDDIYVLTRYSGDMFFYDNFRIYLAGLSDGSYCDIITGRKVNDTCTGMTMTVQNNVCFPTSGSELVTPIGVVALHDRSRI